MGQGPLSGRNLSDFLSHCVPVSPDKEVLMTEVGGQLRCDGRTLKYETVVGYFELEEL